MVETFKALSEPGRLQIVDLLLREPLSVGAVAQRLGMRQPQASKHLRALSDCGLVEARPLAQQRIYALRPQGFQSMDRWLDRYRRMWESQFERLDAVLEQMQTGEGGHEVGKSPARRKRARKQRSQERKK